MTAQPTFFENADRPSSIVKRDVRPDGIALLTIDDVSETHNTITPALGGELTKAFEASLADPDVIAIVLRSGKKDTFMVGANIDFVRTIRFARDAEEASREAAKRFGKLGTSAKPVVAYVHGPALGGGFELSLACTASVASDDPRTVFGLPEVKLGLVPAANGLLRVAERAGLRVALDVGMTGRTLRPKKAYRLGLVDELVPEPAALEAACRLALRLAEDERLRRDLAKARRARAGDRAARLLLERNPIGRAALFRRVRAETQAKTRGHYPAAERIVDIVACFGAAGFAKAAELEPRVFGELVVGETAHRLIDLFFAQTAAKKDTGLEAGEQAAAFPLARVGVLGAGLMGSGIALVSAHAGLAVRMKDTDDAAVGRGLRYVKEHLDARSSLGALERDAVLARVSATTDDTGFKNADLVVEAVYEDLALKHRVIGEIERRVKDTCVIASNTSSIPIAKIAEAAKRPEMIVGMHYFSPVEKMPLVEIVRTKLSDPRAVSTAVALGRKQGKTTIVVNDGPAFYTTRILVPYLNEAAQLLLEGCAIDQIDRALVDWGFPVGPVKLLDEVGIDVAVHVGEVTEAAFGARMQPPAAFAKLRADDRRGRKNGRGFYLYGGKGKGKRVDDAVYGVLGVDPRPDAPSRDEIALRCSLAMVNEALRCLDERILRSARDGDIGALFGVGFPAFRGGPFRYVDAVGAPEVLSRVRSLEHRCGARFEPAPLLVEAARTGRRFY